MMERHKVKWSAGVLLMCLILMVICRSENWTITSDSSRHSTDVISVGSSIRFPDRTRRERPKIVVFEQRLEKVSSLPDSEREAELVKLMEEAISIDPQFVAKNLMCLNIKYSFKYAIARQLLCSWTDHKRSLAWARSSFNGLDRGRYLGLALGVRAITSPAEALMDWKNLDGSERVRKDAFSGLIDGWFVGDRSGLLEYARQADQSGQAGEIFNQISLAWVTSDLPGAISYLENSSGEAYLKTLARMAAAVKTVQNPPTEVFVWAESLHGSAGDEARIAVIETWAERAPQDVAIFLDKAEPHAKLEFGPALVAKWVVSDPLAATRWIDQIPENPSKGQIVSKALKGLMNANTIHASEWLKSMPEGAARDSGILVLLNQESEKDPQGVFPWADALSSEVLREREINRLIGILERQTSQP